MPLCSRCTGEISDCTRHKEKCEECGRTKCPRCNRCYEKIADIAPGAWVTRCPSFWCRIKKKFH